MACRLKATWMAKTRSSKSDRGGAGGGGGGALVRGVGGGYGGGTRGVRSGNGTDRAETGTSTLASVRWPDLSEGERISVPSAWRAVESVDGSAFEVVAREL